MPDRVSPPSPSGSPDPVSPTKQELLDRGAQANLDLPVWWLPRFCAAFAAARHTGAKPLRSLGKLASMGRWPLKASSQTRPPVLRRLVPPVDSTQQSTLVRGSVLWARLLSQRFLLQSGRE